MVHADLNKALFSTLTVARNEVKYVADAETDLGELPIVVCSVSDLNQVFLNLLVNTAHAVGDVVRGTDQKGKIRVRTSSEGSLVLISISGTNAGIPESIRDRTSTPFSRRRKWDVEPAKEWPSRDRSLSMGTKEL